jgi:hypothetical protein
MIPKVYVYVADSSLIIKINDRILAQGAPEAFGLQYQNVPYSRANDTVAITYFGRVVVSNRRIDDFVDESGDIVSPDVELGVLLDYFTSIGLGVQTGGSVDLSNYYTKQQVDAGFVLKSVYNADIAAIQARLTALENGIPPPVRLATPQPVQTAVSDTTATFAWQAIQNATSYEISKDGEVITTVTTLSYQASGLSPETEYEFGVSAIASGYLQSEVGAVLITTDETPTPQPGNNQFPYTFPFTLA